METANAAITRASRWTIADLEDFPKDNRRRELVEGNLILPFENVRSLREPWPTPAA